MKALCKIGLWTIALYGWMLTGASAQLDISREDLTKNQVMDAFNKTVGAYFQLLAKKEPLLIDHFKKVATDDFQCQWRDEATKNKALWADTLQQYLNDSTAHLRYEYQVSDIRLITSNRAIIRLNAVEIRSWVDQLGMFGSAAHTLEYREAFDIDVVLVNVEGEWRWQQLTLYGMGKRAFEQSTKS